MSTHTDPRDAIAAGDPPRGFHWHGARLRVNTIAFRVEDAQFIAEEALRRDCAAADVIRDAVRKLRWESEKEHAGG